MEKLNLLLSKNNSNSSYDENLDSDKEDFNFKPSHSIQNI